jgi:hypothetical protein
MLVFLVANILLSTSSYGQSFPSGTPSDVVMANIDFANNRDASFLISSTYKTNLKDSLPLAGLPEINLVGGEFNGALGFNYDYHHSDTQHYELTRNDCFIRTEAQRGLWDLIAYGVLNYDFTVGATNTLANQKIDYGLKAIEWTLNKVCYDTSVGSTNSTTPWMGQEGDANGYTYTDAGGNNHIAHKAESTQKENTAHNKHMFLAAAGRALRLIKASGTSIYTASRKDKIKFDYASRLFEAANKLSGQTYILEKFFKQAIMDKKSANQLLLAAVAYHEIGTLWWELNDSTQTQNRNDAAALIIRANKMMEQIIGSDAYTTQLGDLTYFRYTGGAVGAQSTALLTNTGVLPEGKYLGETFGGYDSSYHTMSLELMGRYYSTLKTDKSYAVEFKSKLTLALTRFTNKVDSIGVVDTACNTRTYLSGYNSNGEQKIPWRMYYLGFLGVDPGVNLQTLGVAISSKAPVFEHKTPGSQSPAGCLN